MATTSNPVYIARAGDTWDMIGFLKYAEERMASDIIQANPRLGHIVIFEGGERVTLPPAAESKSPDTLPPWRR